ncbi:MAG TPA: MBL fold metallo-hydrolase [Myxococcota bacterium]|nr:MBL fold metallo-hydrolase [Myxococcota bacterium]
MRFVRILLIVLALLALLGFGAARYLLGRTPVPEKSDYALDFDELRRLATSMPGDLPTRVNHQQVAVGSLPKGAVFAGESLRAQQPMSHGAYQVVYPDKTFAMIDSAFSADMMHVMNPTAAFDESAFAVLLHGLAAAKVIVITHEHPDHIGGIALYNNPRDLVGRLMLTKEQLGNAGMMAAAKVPESLQKALTPLEYDKYYAAAPGMVLVKAPGHTPGSQIVYVKLASGKELLFVGDVAWHMDQIRELWYRPRLVTDYFLHENREQVLNQLRTLHDLAQTQPGVQIVVSHDLDQRGQLIKSGLLGDRFEF